MEYSITKKVKMSYDEAVKRVKEELSKEGFGVLCEIDVKQVLKMKINVDFDKYIILGACNPEFAYKALVSEKEIGLFLPCNIIVYENQEEVFASVVKPSVLMGAIDNDTLPVIALEVEEKLSKVINSL